MFHLYLMGAEQATFRRLLLDQGVHNVGLSYWSARKRLPRKKAYSMDWGFDRVYLDSGGYSANKEPTTHTAREWREYGHAYADFALDHVDELEMISEFDSLALGPAWITQMRQEVWSQVPAEKFLPIWHPEFGLPALEEMGERYPRIGIAQDHIAQPGLNITPYLNKLANKDVKLHGLAMSRPDAVRHVRFASVSSTSWLSPMKYGETIIWDGNRLVRYPTKMKDQARTRHRLDFERAGFDIDAIMADDPNEVTRLSVWSWLQYEASMHGVTRRDVSDGTDAADTDSTSVVTAGQGMRKNAPVTRTRDAGEMAPLPVLGFVEHEEIGQDSNERVVYHLPVVNSASLRRCNTCFIREDCPGFEEDTTCKYTLPIEIETPSQRKAVLNGALKMQAQRVAFMRMREELSGGYADPNLSQEIDRLTKMFQAIAEIEDDRDFFRMTMEGRGKAGVLSRLFGKDANDIPDGPKLGPAETDRVLARVIKGKAE